MIILSVLLSGLAAGLLCSYYLQKKQRQKQRDHVKSHFIEPGSEVNDPAINKKPALFKVPFLSALHDKQEAKLRLLRYEAELPRMLDIVAMGMHAGLSFDAALGLYVHRFDSDLALLCRERFDLWERGLISRKEGLEQLSKHIELPLFDYFYQMALRSIKYGVPMTSLTKEYAQQARTEYRNKQKEKVLKAPVKMLLPTGALILPAMMMLVLGPIVLDATGRMM